MPRLSIVIPSIAFDTQVEETLVSVLQHRPELSEILVVTSVPYDDPYRLGREVRFLSHPDRETRLELVNHGCRESRGEIVHLLLPGVVAVDGWTDHIYQHFSQNKVAAVAPILMPGVPTIRFAVSGVTYRAHGAGCAVRAVPGLNSQRADRRPVLAPALSAGFYRRSVLTALRGFDETYGEWLADVEFGLALRDLELMTLVEPRSQVMVEGLVRRTPRSYREAYEAERLYQRCRVDGDRYHRSAHAVMVAWEAMRAFLLPRMWSCLWGRFAGRQVVATHNAYLQRMERARAELSAVQRDGRRAAA